MLPIASVAGVSFAEIAAALATLTAQGTPTAVATTQLRQAILALVAPSTKTKTLMDQLGLSFDADKISAIGLAAAFDEVLRATNGDLVVLRRLLGSSEAVAAVLGLTGQNAKAFAANLDAMALSAGATDAAFRTVDATLSRQLQRSTVRLDNAMTRLGVATLPTLATALEFTVGVVEKFPAGFQAVIDSTPGLETAIEVLGAVFSDFDGYLNFVLGGLQSWLETIERIPDAVDSAVSGVGDALGGAAGAVGGGVGRAFSGLGNIPGFASGGIVPATRGGRVVRVGEGGQAEAIVPLGRGGRGMMGGNTYNLYVDATGGDVNRIADVLFPALQRLEARGSIEPISA